MIVYFDECGFDLNNMSYYFKYDDKIEIRFKNDNPGLSISNISIKEFKKKIKEAEKLGNQEQKKKIKEFFNRFQIMDLD